MYKGSVVELQRNWSHRYRRCLHCYDFVDTWKPHYVGVSCGIKSYLHSSCVMFCTTLRSAEYVDTEGEKPPYYRCETCGNHTTTPYRRTKYGCYCSQECHHDAQQSWMESFLFVPRRKET